MRGGTLPSIYSSVHKNPFCNSKLGFSQNYYGCFCCFHQKLKMQVKSDFYGRCQNQTHKSCNAAAINTNATIGLVLHHPNRYNLMYQASK